MFFRRGINLSAVRIRPLESSRLLDCGISLLHYRALKNTVHYAHRLIFIFSSAIFFIFHRVPYTVFLVDYVICSIFSSTIYYSSTIFHRLYSSLYSLDCGGDWSAVRLAAMFRAAGLSAHRRQEAHQQLQQGARPWLHRLQVSQRNSLLLNVLAFCLKNLFVHIDFFSSHTLYGLTKLKTRMN
jgi:hypothetical protein